MIKQQQKKTIVELLLFSIVEDNDGIRYVKTILLNSNNDDLRQVYAKSIATVDKQPDFFLYAENKLIRKYYSVLYNARFFRVKLTLDHYEVVQDPSSKKGTPTMVVGYPIQSEPQITIVPNIHNK